MAGAWLLAFTLATLLTGTACLGALVVETRRGGSTQARAGLILLSALTILVLGRLLLAYIGAAPHPTPRAVAILSYVESFLGRYGLLFALPYFAHRVFGVAGRDRGLGAVVIAAASLQHVTEFVLGGSVWDDRGDIFEDVLFVAAIAYTLWLGYTRDPRAANEERLAARFLALIVIALPVIAWDLFLSDDAGWRFYPLWYCLLATVLTATLVGRRPVPLAALPSAWALSAREEEVARLVQQGLSNPEIARVLFISPNTVKTHVRAIFDKSGLRTRVALVSTLASGRGREADRNHPPG